MEASDPAKMEWWKKAIIYQVYPRSFQDSTGSGTGDLPGITSRLDYLAELGVGAIWLSPFYPSPQLDFGYDISNFCDVDPSFGTLSDFDTLVKEAHEKGLKIIVDFVGGHTSDAHPWFHKSVRGEKPFSDYYVWDDGKTDEKGVKVPPNNWLSVFSGTSWAWNSERQQFFYRPFIPEQPKLNYRCPQLVEQMKNVLRFWFDRGVDGMRLDAINEMVEAEDKSLNEPRDMTANCPPGEYEYLRHIHTCHQPETFKVIKGWSEVMEEYNSKDGGQRFMIGETPSEASMRNRFRESGILPFNMDLVDTLSSMGLSGESVRTAVDMEYSNLPPGAWPTFVVGNHDRHRLGSRFEPIYRDAFNTLLLLLKGTPTTYYGEEIGMCDIEVSYEDTQDPFGIKVGPERYLIFSRDPARSPMQWDNSTNAGFTSSARPWLPVASDYPRCNVKHELSCEGKSYLKLYKILASLRKEPAFAHGSLSYAYTSKEIFAFLREDKASDSGDRYLVVLNFGKATCSPKGLSATPVNANQGCVVAAGGCVDALMDMGRTVALDSLTLAPGDCMVIKLNK